MRENTVVLPAPDGPTNAVIPPGRDDEADAVVDEGQVRRIPEQHPLEGDRCGRAAGFGQTGRRAGRLDRQGLGLQDPGHRGGARPWYWVTAPDELVDRCHEEEHVEQERDERADGDAARGDPEPADAEHREERHLDRQPGRVAGDARSTWPRAHWPATPRWPRRRAARPSRSSAPDALTVRNAPNMRSSAAPITPTDSCARLAARLMRGTTTPMTDDRRGRARPG